MGKAKRKTVWQIMISKWRKVNYAKRKGKKKNHLECFFSEGKVHHLVLQDKVPCPHSSCEKDPHFLKRNGISQHFRVVHKCTFVDVNLQESLVLRRRLHAKETTDIPNEFFKSRSEKVRQILVLVRHYFSSKSRKGNGSQPKSRNRSSLDRNRTKSVRRLKFLCDPSQRPLRPR